MKIIAVYPGTFDPVTNGHLDIIQRASGIFTEVIVAVSNNLGKNPLFSIEEREKLIKDSVGEINNVIVERFEGLLVHYAKRVGASVVIRGLRAVSDFDYEFQMALMNRKLVSELETVYLMPSEEYSYINSTIVKEIARLGGKLDSFLPKAVSEALDSKFSKTG